MSDHADWPGLMSAIAATGAEHILMPDYVVMITTLGGMVVFGINGFVLGPVIAAMFFAVWHLYLTTRPVATPPSGPSEP